MPRPQSRPSTSSKTLAPPGTKASPPPALQLLFVELPSHRPSQVLLGLAGTDRELRGRLTAFSSGQSLCRHLRGDIAHRSKRAPLSSELQKAMIFAPPTTEGRFGLKDDPAFGKLKLRRGEGWWRKDDTLDVLFTGPLPLSPIRPSSLDVEVASPQLICPDQRRPHLQCKLPGGRSTRMGEGMDRSGG